MTFVFAIHSIHADGDPSPWFQIIVKASPEHFPGLYYLQTRHTELTFVINCDSYTEDPLSAIRHEVQMKTGKDCVVLSEIESDLVFGVCEFMWHPRNEAMTWKEYFENYTTAEKPFIYSYADTVTGDEPIVIHVLDD